MESVEEGSVETEVRGSKERSVQTPLEGEVGIIHQVPSLGP
jgi:hypothetical protein